MPKPNKKHYILFIWDSDGDQHHYYFFASSPWMVSHYVIAIMQIDGDFYGHTHKMTQDIEIIEQSGPPTDIIPLEIN